jgi:NADPH-dependent ferric siderophore reductase
MNEPPQVTRLRHELERRHLEVARVERLGPRVSRVVLSGGDLAGFMSLAAEDQLKLFFAESASGWIREAPPRRDDEPAGELWVDLVLRATGRVAIWARRISAS